MSAAPASKLPQHRILTGKSWRTAARRIRSRPGSFGSRIDTNGDAVADISYRVRFSAFGDRSQTAALRRAEGAEAKRTGDGGQVIVEGAPASMGREAQVTRAGEYRFFAGWRSDPFLFDPLGTLNNLQFTGADFLADKNVCGIVLEVPNSDLGTRRVGLWARTLIGVDGNWIQADRGALPQQAVFLVGAERDAYLSGEPADDDRFLSVFAHSLEHTGGYAPEEAKRAARTLLPDVLCYDPTRPASFPSNGRTLTDDAADVFLAVLTNGKVTEDKVGPHGDSASRVSLSGSASQCLQSAQGATRCGREL